MPQWSQFEKLGVGKAFGEVPGHFEGCTGQNSPKTAFHGVFLAFCGPFYGFLSPPHNANVSGIATWLIGLIGCRFCQMSSKSCALKVGVAGEKNS